MGKKYKLIITSAIKHLNDVILSPSPVILSEAKNLMNSTSRETLHGACPERDSSVASLLQNDKKRRVQDDHFTRRVNIKLTEKIFPLHNPPQSFERYYLWTTTLSLPLSFALKRASSEQDMRSSCVVILTFGKVAMPMLTVRPVLFFMLLNL